MGDLGNISKSLAESVRAIKDAATFRMPDMSAFRVFEVPSFRMAEIRNPLVDASNANLASEFCKRLEKWMRDFEAELDQEHEVGACLVGFNETVVFRLTSIGYWNPSLVCFMGATEDGSPVKLIQHVTQISVLLKKLRRTDLSKPKDRIGFVSEAEGVEGPEET